MRRQARREDREVPPLVAALKQYLGKMEFITIPVIHIGTALSKTQWSRSEALSNMFRMPNSDFIRLNAV